MYWLPWVTRIYFCCFWSSHPQLVFKSSHYKMSLGISWKTVFCCLTSQRNYALDEGCRTYSPWAGPCRAGIWSASHWLCSFFSQAAAASYLQAPSIPSFPLILKVQLLVSGTRSPREWAEKKTLRFSQIPCLSPRLKQTSSQASHCQTENTAGVQGQLSVYFSLELGGEPCWIFFFFFKKIFYIYI